MSSSDTKIAGDSVQVYSAGTAVTPPASLTTMWHGSGGQSMQWENVVALDRGEPLKWSGASRRCIETDDRDFEFIAILPAATTQSIATHPLSGLPGQAP